jgi:hypothetical protein
LGRDFGAIGAGARCSAPLFGDLTEAPAKSSAAFHFEKVMCSEKEQIGAAKPARCRMRHFNVQSA